MAIVETWPDVFDGVIGGDPDNYHSHTVAAQIQYQQYFAANTSSSMTAYQWSLLGAEALKQCSYGQNTSECLNQDQVTAVKKFYSTWTDGTGLAHNPNITAFLANKGKLLHYHGFSDPLISPAASIEWYEALHAFTKTYTTFNLDSLYKFYPIPGMAHCSGGPGAVSFPAFAHYLGDGLDENKASSFECY
ncbi:hypothetical protein RQP46_006176 [Phenoliferia psychrophenolica]